MINTIPKVLFTGMKYSFDNRDDVDRMISKANAAGFVPSTEFIKPDKPYQKALWLVTISAGKA